MIEADFWREAFRGGFQLAFRDLEKPGVPGGVLLWRIGLPLREGEVWPDESLLSLTKAQATDLMDQLLAAGVRPSGESPTEMAATQRHLSDMRVLVFERLLPLDRSERPGIYRTEIPADDPRVNR